MTRTTTTAQNEAMLERSRCRPRADPDLRVRARARAGGGGGTRPRHALDALGIDLPLVADRDGIIGSAWGLAYYPSLVFLDEAGRVAGYGAGACLDTQELVRAFRDGGAMPAPTIALNGPGCP